MYAHLMPQLSGMRMHLRATQPSGEFEGAGRFHSPMPVSQDMEHSRWALARNSAFGAVSPLTPSSLPEALGYMAVSSDPDYRWSSLGVMGRSEDPRDTHKHELHFQRYLQNTQLTNAQQTAISQDGLNQLRKLVYHHVKANLGKPVPPLTDEQLMVYLTQVLSVPRCRPPMNPTDELEDLWRQCLTLIIPDLVENYRHHELYLNNIQISNRLFDRPANTQNRQEVVSLQTNERVSVNPPRIAQYTD